MNKVKIEELKERLILEEAEVAKTKFEIEHYKKLEAKQ
jgi:hypothetical protein